MIYFVVRKLAAKKAPLNFYTLSKYYCTVHETKILDDKSPSKMPHLSFFVVVVELAMWAHLVADEVVEPLGVDVLDDVPALALLVHPDNGLLKHPGDAQLAVLVDRLATLVALVRVQHVQGDFLQAIAKKKSEKNLEAALLLVSHWLASP